MSLTTAIDYTQGRYFVSTGPGTAVIHIVGAASYLNSRALSGFLDLHARSAVKKQLHFNLSECRSVDSTVAGLIAKCAFDLVEGNRWGRIGIAGAQPRVRETLEMLGLAHIADFVEVPPSGAAPGVHSMSRYVDSFGASPPPEIFRAHEALIALDASNFDRFAGVLSALRDDIASSAPVEESEGAAPHQPAGIPAVKRGAIKFSVKPPAPPKLVPGL